MLAPTPGPLHNQKISPHNNLHINKDTNSHICDAQYVTCHFHFVKIVCRMFRQVRFFLTKHNTNSTSKVSYMHQKLTVYTLISSRSLISWTRNFILQASKCLLKKNEWAFRSLISWRFNPNTGPLSENCVVISGVAANIVLRVVLFVIMSETKKICKRLHRAATTPK